MLRTSTAQNLVMRGSIQDAVKIEGVYNEACLEQKGASVTQDDIYTHISTQVQMVCYILALH